MYAISVAAELVGTGQQNLRMYERKGLLEPGRTEGGTRLYSDADVARLRRIAELLALGLNVAGIGLVLELEAENESLRREISRSRAGSGKGS
ncbi:MerR family transcriptional regulator [Paeniglutamicibacter sp. ZC-3]|uniref:MerR family transcriptional regulator n=1 Tax=Paeniglutamicibacter sp. ZC-3 TaxID=2986919 RepID=UPI0035575848